jgi:hypothetical protein
MDELLRLVSLGSKDGGGGGGAAASGLVKLTKTDLLVKDLLLERLTLLRRVGLRWFDDLTLCGAERRGSVGGSERERRLRQALGLRSVVLLVCDDALVEALAELVVALPCEGRSLCVSTASMKARRWSFGKRLGSLKCVLALAQCSCHMPLCTSLALWKAFTFAARAGWSMGC